MRRGAELDPRYAGQLQPPYPAAEQRAQREGRVQVRVTIAPSGRVSAVVRLMATSDAFWRVTEQQALNHWRFRPATVDGRPVEGSKVMTLIFRHRECGLTHAPHCERSEAIQTLRPSRNAGSLA